MYGYIRVKVGGIDGAKATEELTVGLQQEGIIDIDDETVAKQYRENRLIVYGYEIRVHLRRIRDIYRFRALMDEFCEFSPYKGCVEWRIRFRKNVWAYPNGLKKVLNE